MPRPSQEGKILEAALKCFAEKGYEATTTRNIADEAGVTEGAIYRHYPSKEAVAQALFSYHMERYAGGLQAIAGSGQGVKERLQQVVMALLVEYRTNPNAATFVLLRQHNFLPKLPPGFIYPLEIIEAIIKEGQTEELIRDGQPNLLAAIFLGCILRPIILSQLASPGAFELLNETKHDRIISESAWNSIRYYKD
jgi:AcrR family transcriptional regulator